MKRERDIQTAKMLNSIISTAEKHGLLPTGDSIEDYGRHFYFVRRCGKGWDAIQV